VTVQSVIRDVCAFVGVRPPNGSVFVTPEQDRTAWEFVNLANEMAQRIAYDTRDWQMLREPCEFTGDGTTASFPLPANWQRMLKTAQVRSTTHPLSPLTYISDPDQWLRNEMNTGFVSALGSWTIFGNAMHFAPPLAAAEKVKFYYLRNTCVKLNSGGFGDRFLNDADTFVLPERLLKLGMIWQWKAYKGGTYAEDIANYEDALAMIAGSDKPSPILIGRQTLNTDASVAYWGDVPPPGTFVGP
jgi:hypothetical protein